MSLTVALTELPADLDAFLQAIAPLSHDAHRHRAAGFKSHKRRAEFLTGRLLLSHLCHHQQVDFSWPADEQLLDNPGRVIHTAPGVTASISHSGNYVLVALGENVQRLGVDCESGGHLRNFEAVARRHFTDREASYLKGLPQQDIKPNFLRHWVLKEAWLKATGQGIAGGLKSVELLQEQQLALHSTEFGEAWQFWQGVAGSAVLGVSWQAWRAQTPTFLKVDGLLATNPVVKAATNVHGHTLTVRPSAVSR